MLYRLPDHPRLLQSYVWQDDDLAPKFPKLVEFPGLLGRQSRRAALSSARRSATADRPRKNLPSLRGAQAELKIACGS